MGTRVGGKTLRCKELVVGGRKGGGGGGSGTAARRVVASASICGARARAFCTAACSEGERRASEVGERGRGKARGGLERRRRDWERERRRVVWGWTTV